MKPKVTGKQRIQIYKRNKAGELIQALAEEYNTTPETIEKIIEFHRTPKALRGIYWKGARSEEEANQAKESYLKISRKYQ